MFGKNDIEVLDFRTFVKGDNGNTNVSHQTQTKLAALSGGISSLTIPAITFAQGTLTDDTFNRIWIMLLNVGDWMCGGVIFFAGTSWMLGHRSKAIELLISGACGYIVLRHALDIRDFLKTI
ncbi:glycosyltransferase [Pseudalkalibacillus sp. R45]|uniref:glycosyltransferase n=1 Tax=Pseudalkalibacillus sp. R45 TaxID=3457433 RepID=UPI003FCE038F